MIEKIIKVITPSEAKINELESSYGAVCTYIENNTSYEIHSFAQGSQAIGTLIKPISGDGDYDIDIVTVIKHKFNNAEDQKLYIGDILKSSDRYASLLAAEGKRCWTLEYSDTLNYHLDILPAVQFDDKLLITNKTATGYEYRTTNPVSYAAWFLGKANNKLLNTREYLDMPKNNAETDLQKLVMFAKYHRDIFCTKNNIDDTKPISVIITTAFGLSYDPKQGLLENLKLFIAFCRKNIISQVSPYEFCSPVDENENFCDKWNENLYKAIVFKNWIQNFEDLLLDEINGKIIAENFGVYVASTLYEMTNEEYEKKAKPHRSYGKIQ